VFFRAKFQLGRVTLSRLRSSYRSKYRKRIFWLNLTFWPWNFKWTLIAALATGAWQFGPCRYVLIWLPPLNKKCHLQLNSEFWPADYKGNFTDSKKYILPKRPGVRTVSVTVQQITGVSKRKCRSLKVLFVIHLLRVFLERYLSYSSKFCSSWQDFN